MRVLLLPVCALLVGCGSERQPTTPTPTPVPVTATVTGRVTAVNGGQAIANALIEFNGQQARTSADGAYSFTFTTPPSAADMLITAPNILRRSLRAAISTRALDADVIVRDGPFDLAFYRRFVRDGHERPASLQPLRRFGQAPRIYLRTVDEAGRAISAALLDMTAAALINTTGQLTGRFGLAELARGTETRFQQGWITVEWMAQQDGNVCGRSSGVGVEGGSIRLHYTRPGCWCPGTQQLRPGTVKHELGHALGFWHTDNPSDLMFVSASSQTCDRNPSEREKYHAAIAYARPIGNRDEDDDRLTTIR